MSSASEADQRVLPEDAFEVRLKWGVQDPPMDPLQFLRQKTNEVEFTSLRKAVDDALKRWPESSSSDNASLSKFKSILQEMNDEASNAANEALSPENRAEAMTYLPGSLSKAKEALSSLSDQMIAILNMASIHTLKDCVETYARARDSLPKGEFVSDIIDRISVTATATAGASPKVNFSMEAVDIWNRASRDSETSGGSFVDGEIVPFEDSYHFLADGTFFASTHVKDDMMRKANQAASFFRSCPNGVLSEQGQPNPDFARAADVSEFPIITRSHTSFCHSYSSYSSSPSIASRSNRYHAMQGIWQTSSQRRPVLERVCNGTGSREAMSPSPLTQHPRPRPPRLGPFALVAVDQSRWGMYVVVYV